MRVLVISRAPWRNDNNTGNTLTNMFEGFSDFEFYNLYFREQLPKNDIAKKSFTISEGQLIRNLLKKTPVGKEICEKDSIQPIGEEKIYKSAKKGSSVILSLVREVLWSISRWKSENLVKFLEQTKPDVIFMPVFNCFYPHKVLRFVKKKTNAKVVLFHADDNYTLRQFSFSPLYWLYRFNLRKWVKKSVDLSDLNYAISKVQINDYEKAFKREIKLLTKGVDFSKAIPKKETYNEPLQLVFTGNININRWRSLAVIAEVLHKINQSGVKFQMKIYTATPLTNNMKKALNIKGTSQIMGYIEADKVAEIQQNADILIHVEATDIKNRLLVRQSFSTKIIDYFAIGRPILAYGPKEVASISHLVENNCAIVADSANELYDKLSAIANSTQQLDEFIVNAFTCGKKYHDKENIRKMIIEDFSISS